MKTNNLLAICAVVAIIIALINVSITLIKVSQITGYATTTGVVNLTIMQVIDLNMSNDTMQWGHGRVNPGETNATLNTSQTTATVTRGNWSTGTYNPAALILENIGNINASLKIQATNNASQLFNSQSWTNQEYKWRITNRETGACNNVTGPDDGFDDWADVNTTTDGTKFCDQFGYDTSINEIYIDIWLTVPYDSLNATVDGSAVITDTITAVGSTAG